MASVFRSLATGLSTLAFAVLVAGCSSSSSPSTTPSTTAPVEGVQVGNVATDFTLKDADGREVKLADYRGKVVLFEFSAMW